MFKKDGKQNPEVLHSFEQHWPNIQPLVKRLIYNEPISKFEWQNIFCDVHMICSWDQYGCHKLLVALEKELIGSIIEDIKFKLCQIEDCDQQLKEYINYWNDFENHCRRIPVAFQQLDLATRKTIKGNIVHSKREHSTVRYHMLKLWDQHVLNPHWSRLTNSTFNLILAERMGRIVNSQLIVGFRESCSYINQHTGNVHNFYKRNFEESYILELEIFYSAKAIEELKILGVLDYTEWALHKIEKEERKAEIYLENNPEIFKRVTETCIKVLVENFVEQVLVESLPYIKGNDFENAKLIFQFVSKVEGSAERLLQELGNHIVTTGMGHLMNSPSITTNSEKFVEKLLDSYKHFNRFIHVSFNNDLRAKAILDKAFEIIVNDAQVFNSNRFDQDITTPSKQPNLVNKNMQLESKCPELLATYCDLLLRKTNLSRKLTPDEIIERLNEVLLIIKCVKNKDAFMRYYKAHLARRLILNVASSSEKEEQYLNCLRETAFMPTEYTYKLVRMFKDLKNSEEVQQRFMKTLEPIIKMESVKNNNNNTIQSLSSHISVNLNMQDNNNKTPGNVYDNINFRILNPSAWTKSNEKLLINLPPDMSSTLTSFEAFYTDHYAGRKLEWCHRFSNGTITFTSDKGKYDLDVTAAQLSILSSFNSLPRASKTLDDLEKQSGLIPTELRRTLWSLVANPKLKLQPLACNMELNEMKELDREGNEFSINYNFLLIKNGKPQVKGRISLIGRLQI